MELLLTNKNDQALVNPPNSKSKNKVLVGKSNLSTELGFDRGAWVCPAMSDDFWECPLVLSMHVLFSN